MDSVAVAQGLEIHVLTHCRRLCRLSHPNLPSDAIPANETFESIKVSYNSS